MTLNTNKPNVFLYIRAYISLYVLRSLASHFISTIFFSFFWSFWNEHFAKITSAKLCLLNLSILFNFSRNIFFFFFKNNSRKKNRYWHTLFAYFFAFLEILFPRKTRSISQKQLCSWKKKEELRISLFFSITEQNQRLQLE